MRVAQISPLFERVPPIKYGGTERIVSYLTEGLISAGVDVSLFASADSHTSGVLVPSCSNACRLTRLSISQSMTEHAFLLNRVAELADEFDIIHFHWDALHLPLMMRMLHKCVTTMHGRMDLPWQERCYLPFSEMCFSAISESQKNSAPRLNWVDVIHHGLPIELYDYNARSDGYLAFVGRVSPEKGVDRAIQIANMARKDLVIAAKIGEDSHYFESQIAPRIGKNISFVGEVNDEEKSKIIGRADALLFPIDWPEPFGLVVIEAMACGTPVVAFPCGAVPELIVDGVTGYLVDSVCDAAKSLEKINKISRERCRLEFEARFSLDVMIKNYVAMYENLLGGNGGSHVR